MYTLSAMKHKGRVRNGRLDYSTQMEFFSLMLKWNMKLRIGFSSWDKMKNLDENQVLDKKQTKPTKNPHLTPAYKPWVFWIDICISIQSFTQFVEKLPASCK